jgi:arylsulfatase A-like enzyme
MRSILNAACVATLATFGLAWWDAFSLRELDVPYRTGMGLSAGAGFVTAVACTLLATVLFALAAAPLRSWITWWREQHAEAGAAALWASVGCVVITAVGFATLWSCQSRLVTEEVSRLVVLVTVSGFAATWLALRVELEAQVARALKLGAPRWLAPAATAVIALAWVVAALAIAMPILDQLDLRPLSSWAVVALLAVLGVCLPAAGRRITRWATRGLRGLALVVVLAGGVLIAVAASAKKPGRLDLALELRATSTSSIIKWLRASDYQRVRPAEPPADRSAVCWPSATPPTLSDVVMTPADVDIIFVTVDALRYDHTSLAGYERDTTPNLLRHAATGVVFERAYSLTGTTRQTFRGLFTGVYASLVHDVRGHMKWGFGFTDAQVTLAEYLRHAGFDTIAYSPVDGILSLESGALDGFSEVDESASDLREERIHTTGYIVDKIIERLSQPRAAGGRFVWSHLMAPHNPYPPGPEPVSYGDERLDRYDASIHFADRELGRLLDFARSPERAGRSWIIVTADHGEEFGEHGGQGHSERVYEETAHVPMMIWGPSVVPQRLSTRISQIHLVRTILEIAGVTPPDALCGASLMACLRGREPPPDEPVFMETIPDYGRTHFRTVVIADDIKTTVLPISGGRELYDLRVDPGEQNNLARDKPELLDKQLEIMRQLHRRHGRNLAAYGL